VGSPYELHIALRYLKFHRGTAFLSLITLISIVGFTLGTAALVIALSLNAGFQADVRERIRSGSAHLNVTNSLHFPFEGVAEVLERVRGMAEVEAAAPVIYTPAMIAAPDGGSPSYAEVHGIDPVEHGRVIPRDDQDPWSVLEHVGPSGRPGIVLGRELARRLGVLVGDTVRVIVPSMRLSPLGPIPRSQVFDVVGTYSSDYFQEDSQRAYLTTEAARHLLRSGDVAHWIEVRTRDVRRIADVKLAMREALGPPWAVLDMVEENQDIIKALNTEKIILFAAIGLIVVVAASNMLSTLILMVTDKVKEIGALSALGARPPGIALVFVLQGAVIGVVGTVLGLGLGTAISWAMDTWQLWKLDPDVYYITYLPFRIRAVDLLSIAGLTILISLASTVYPSWKAARLDPVEALRYE